MQGEQVAWSLRNFGAQHARYPLMGMIEELLEFDEAWKLKEEAHGRHGEAKGADPMLVSPELDKEITDADRELELTKLYAEVYDAIGDIAIYMLDYCGKSGLQLNDLWNRRTFLDERMRKNWNDLAPLARRLAHHQLKGEQGIRGSKEDHDKEIVKTCEGILAHLDLICRYLKKDFIVILEAVWAKVRLRDWTKNKNNAHKVAEQQVIDMTNAAGNTDP